MLPESLRIAGTFRVTSPIKPPIAPHLTRRRVSSRSSASAVPPVVRWLIAMGCPAASNAKVFERTPDAAGSWQRDRPAAPAAARCQQQLVLQRHPHAVEVAVQNAGQEVAVFLVVGGAFLRETAVVRYLCSVGSGEGERDRPQWMSQCRRPCNRRPSTGYETTLTVRS